MKDPLREEIIGYLLTNQEKFYRLAFSYVHNPDAALDVVQNAIVKALEHYNSIRNIKYIKTWFYRVLVNECLTALQDVYKRQGQQPCGFIPQGCLELFHFISTALRSKNFSEYVEHRTVRTILKEVKRLHRSRHCCIEPE